MRPSGRSSTTPKTMPTEQTQVIIEHMHGAASRVAAGADGIRIEAGALQRKYYSCVDASRRMTEKCIAWAQGFASLLAEFGASDAYVNYLGDEGTAGGEGLLWGELWAARRPEEEVRSG